MNAPSCPLPPKGSAEFVMPEEVGFWRGAYGYELHRRLRWVLTARGQSVELDLVSITRNDKDELDIVATDGHRLHWWHVAVHVFQQVNPTAWHIPRVRQPLTCSLPDELLERCSVFTVSKVTEEDVVLIPAPGTLFPNWRKVVPPKAPMGETLKFRMGPTKYRWLCAGETAARFQRVLAAATQGRASMNAAYLMDLALPGVASEWAPSMQEGAQASAPVQFYHLARRHAEGTGTLRAVIMPIG